MLVARALARLPLSAACYRSLWQAAFDCHWLPALQHIMLAERGLSLQRVIGQNVVEQPLTGLNCIACRVASCRLGCTAQRLQHQSLAQSSQWWVAVHWDSRFINLFASSRYEPRSCISAADILTYQATRGRTVPAFTLLRTCSTAGDKRGHMSACWSLST
jgi:hypothetical protein